MKIKEINKTNSFQKFSFTLTPFEILNIVASSRNFFPVKAKGILVYGNGYTRLVGENGYQITVENLPANIPNETAVEIEGIVQCYTHINGGIYPRLIAKNVVTLTDEALSFSFEEEKLLNLLKTKNSFHGFFSYLENLIIERSNAKEGIYLKIAIIRGKNAQTHLDFERGFFETAGSFGKFAQIESHEVTLSNDDEVAEKIRQLEKTDLIFIVRGGGSKTELSSIGGIKTCHVIIESKIPVFLAIGHSLDKSISLLEKVAYASFPTPSLAGVELGRAVKLIYENINLCESARAIKVLEREISKLNKDLSSYKLATIILVLLLLGTFVTFFFK